MSFPRQAPSILAWGLAIACWLWVFYASRRRARLLEKLSREHAGFLRTRFFLPSLSLEPIDLTYARVFSGVPVKFTVRYELPFMGRNAFPCTIFEFELREAAFGAEGGIYTMADYRTGQGLFLGGANLTQSYGRFLSVVPHASRFKLAWRGSAAWLSVPGLLDSREEIWVRHCLEFMEASAETVCGTGVGRG